MIARIIIWWIIFSTSWECYCSDESACCWWSRRIVSQLRGLRDCLSLALSLLWTRSCGHSMPRLTCALFYRSYKCMTLMAIWSLQALLLRPQPTLVPPMIRSSDHNLKKLLLAPLASLPAASSSTLYTYYLFCWCSIILPSMRSSKCVQLLISGYICKTIIEFSPITTTIFELCFSSMEIVKIDVEQYERFVWMFPSYITLNK